LRAADAVATDSPGRCVGLKNSAFTLPWTPPFLNKHGGMVLSIGQFNQWAGSQLMATGLVQIWPGTPVSEPLIADRKVEGLRLADQGVDKSGAPTDGFMAGMDVRASLTVVGDGPVGAVGQALDEKLGLPAGHAHREWALGMKFVIELPDDSNLENSPLQPGTVWHSFGYPEPEIFGFLYVHPERLVSVGIFVPSWMSDPSRTAYRYLQHYIQHPALWKYLKDGTLRSWGAKSLEESGRTASRSSPATAYARIGEGSGSTNMLTGSGVDEAWATGTQLGEAVIELLRAGKPFTQENLAATYETRRRASWVERGAKEAENARNGFQDGIVKGMIGMALAGLTGGKLSLRAHIPPAHKQIRPFASPTPTTGLKLKDRQRSLAHRRWPLLPRCAALGARLAGDSLRWPSAGHAAGRAADGRQGPGDARLRRSRRLPQSGALCIACGEKTCIAMCSGQAITLGRGRRCPPSSAKSASTAAPACGTAATRPTASTVTSSSAPARRAAFGGKLRPCAVAAEILPV
jgi:electron-transferring-flavoprotein dehydrogenase